VEQVYNPLDPVDASDCGSDHRSIALVIDLAAKVDYTSRRVDRDTAAQLLFQATERLTSDLLSERDVVVFLGAAVQMRNAPSQLAGSWIESAVEGTSGSALSLSDQRAAPSSQHIKELGAACATAIRIKEILDRRSPGRGPRGHHRELNGMRNASQRRSSSHALSFLAARHCAWIELFATFEP
jgi:hypothetical protein